MLYGANGYTGRLIVEEAVRHGQRPVLAGRDPRAIEGLAARYGLDFQVFPLDDARVIEAELAKVSALCLAAGPFSRTSLPALNACLSTRTHYLDITGEIDVIEAVMARSEEARSAGVSLLPAMGFDVVPSDCLARKLREALPSATSLELAFFGGSSPSGGTAKTMLEGLPRGGLVRSGGRLSPVPFAHATLEVPFRDETRPAISVPWGDVSSAYYSTGIPNIVTYLALPRGQALGLRALGGLAPALGARPLRGLMARLAERAAKGPDEATRARSRMQLWGRVTAPDGRAAEGTLTTPDGYTLTARTAVEAATRAAQGRTLPGAFTPAMAFGAGFVTEFGGCDLRAPKSA
jgi:short subunit dehydrogenase-like uncharacterized protein